MMAPQKYLHELLEEDQEPFLLKKYISDRRSQIKRPSPKMSLQVKKLRKSTNQNTNLNLPGINLCKSACLFSLTDTPDLRKSPLLEAKSPCKSPNAIFLHIPSRTASLLLEAAIRIQKHSSQPKTKAQSFGLLGSLYKRLTQRSHKKRQIEGGGGAKVSVKDILSVGIRRKNSHNNNTETNEDKSVHMETSTSGNSQEIHFATNYNHSTCFCESPFRFVLQTSGHHTTQEKESNEGESVKKLESGEEEEEDKEQCSPVCVLDPPFEDDEEGHGNGDEEEGDFDLECSYAIVQRAKQQLLYKLRRFEKLAELDPVELEKIMQDQERDEDETFMEEKDDDDDENEQASCKENDLSELIFQALCQSRVHDRQQIPEDFKKLVSDLIMEEERTLDYLEDRDMVISKICKRLELWKEVESNTIDMMIEDDFTREDGGWKNNMEQIRNMAGELEFAIFGFLVEEVSEELVC